MFKKTTMLLSVLLVLVIGTLTGCGQDNPKTAIFVVGNHANSTQLPLNDADTYNLISKVMDTETGGKFSIIEVDGNPYEVANGTIPEINSDFSETRKNSLKAKNVEVLYEAFEKAAPLTPEVDTMTALTMAGKRAVSSEGDKQIVMIDNGVITTGPVDGKTMFNADTDWLVKQLKDRNLLPSLEGAEVTWIGCGDLSSGSQKSPSESVKRDLKDKWRAIIEASGGHVEFLSALSLIKRSDEDKMPNVTGIDIPEETPISYTTGDGIDPDNPNKFSEEEFRFSPDSADLINKDESQAVVKAIAKFMCDNPNIRILIAGSVAGDTESKKGEELSRMRAETIKDMLVQTGVSEKRIKAIGLGIHSPWRVDGLGVGEEAAPNRHVIVINMDTTIAKKLMP